MTKASSAKARDKSEAKSAAAVSSSAKTQPPKTRREIFAEQVSLGRSRSDAARLAGYHPANVNNLMRHDEVQEYLAKARATTAELTTIKRLDVLNVFLEAITLARNLADPAQMIAGAREIGKMMGFYEPETVRVEMSAEHAVIAAKFREMSDEDLYELASQKACLPAPTTITNEEETA
jgi:phage terminase small subunit